MTKITAIPAERFSLFRNAKFGLRKNVLFSDNKHVEFKEAQAENNNVILT